MAKSVLQLDASKAVKAINQLSGAVDKNKAAVKDSTKVTKEHNKAANLAQRSLEAWAKNLSNSNTQLRSFNSAATAANTKIRALGASTAVASRQMASMGANTRSTNTAMRSAANSAVAFAQKFAQANSAIAADNRAVARSTTLMNAFNAQMRTVVATMDKKNNALFVQKARVEADTKAVQKSTSAHHDLILTMHNVARIAVGLAIHRAFLRTSQAIIQATHDAIEFDLVIGQIRTISDRAAKSTAEWGGELIALSEAFGLEQLDAAEAAYQSLSNQATEAGTTLSFLAEESRLAVIAAGNLEDSVDATTSVLNAWQLSTEHTREVNDLLFATVDRGRVRLNELANTMGRINVLSAELGISFREQQGSLSLLTQKGLNNAEAMTLIRGVQQKLIQPTEHTTELFRQWGVTSGENAIATFGFVGVLNKFLQTAVESGDKMEEFGKIMNRVRGIIGLAGLTQTDLNEELKELDKSAEQAGGAFEDSMNRLGRRALIQKAEIKGFFLEVGTRLANFLTTLAEGFGGARNTLNNLTSILFNGAAALVAYKVATIASSLALADWGTRTSLNTRLTLLFHGRLSAATVGLNLFNIALTAGVFALTFIAADIARANHEIDNFGQQVEAAGHRVEVAFNQMTGVTLEEKFKKDQVATRGLSDRLNELDRALNLNVANARARFAALDEIKFDKVGKELASKIGDPLRDVGKEIDDLLRKAEKLRDDAKTKEEKLADDAFAARVEKAKATGVDGDTPKEAKKRLEDFVKVLESELPAADAAQFERLADEIKNSREELIALEKQAYETNKALRDAAIEADKNAPILSDKQKKRQAVEEARRRRFAEARGLDLPARPDTAAELGQKALDNATAIKAQEEALNALLEKRLTLRQAEIDKLNEEAKKLETEGSTRKPAFDALTKTFELLDELGVDASIEQLRLFNESIAKQAEAAGVSAEERLKIEENLQQRIALLQEKERREETEKQLDAQKQANEAKIASLKAPLDAQVKAAEEAKAIREQELKDILKANVELQKFFERAFIPVGVKTDPLALIGGLQQRPIGNDPALAKLKLQFDDLTKSLDRFAEHQTEGSLKNLNLSIRDIVSNLQTLNKEDLARFFDSIFAKDLGKLVPKDKDGNLIISEDELGRVKTLPELIQEMINSFNTLQTSEQGLKTVAEATTGLDEELQKAQQDADFINQAFERMGPVVDSAMGQAAEATRKLREELERLNATIPQVINVGNPKPTTLGLQNKAFGGTASGTDRIPAMLGDGERVFTRNASNTFAPLIGAMERIANTGTRATGSSVTFGDINITAQPGTSEQQASDIVRIVQRHLRLTRSSIN